MKDFILDLDKPRELRFGFKAMREIRAKFGNRSLDQLMNIKVEEIPKLVWAGLKWEDKTLTVEQVENRLDDAIPKKYTIMKITEFVLEALAAQMGIDIKKTEAGNRKKKEEAKKEKPKVKPEAKKVIPSTKRQGK